MFSFRLRDRKIKSKLSFKNFIPKQTKKLRFIPPSWKVNGNSKGVGGYKEKISKRSGRFTETLYTTGYIINLSLNDEIGELDASAMVKPCKNLANVKVSIATLSAKRPLSPKYKYYQKGRRVRSR